MPERDIGLIGLGVMGQNLALNFHNHGYPVAVYNRTAQRTKDLTAKHPELNGTYSIREFVDSLTRPRKVFLMVTAGPAVDDTISSLQALLARGDIIMDGGNSFFKDTERRYGELAKLGVRYLGVGVSGGEEGALKGPCIMVGGDAEAYAKVEGMLTRVAAQADGPCCQLLGPRGAGHYVKMVHNGIEYGIIQVIAEAYDILTRGARMKHGKVQSVFKKWSKTTLKSFLFEIAAEVLAKTDPETREPLVSLILDRAQQKGTGKWTSQNAFDLGVPTPTIDAAVAARNLSSMKEERGNAGKILGGKKQRPLGASVVGLLESALNASMITCYAQGFSLMRGASKEYDYNIPYAEVARIWKGGCIIRAQLLDTIERALKRNPGLSNLLVDPILSRELLKLDAKWRSLVGTAKAASIPIPAISASLDYYDGYRSERLPANLIQGLRDRFGAHGYERIDRSGSFHSEWP